MTLLLDQRTGSIELHPLLRTPHTVCHLDFGDAAIIGRTNDQEISVGIERKRIHDLLSSMESGRLVGHQIPGMLEEYDRSYVLVEGLWRPDDDRRLVVYKGKGFSPIQHGSRRYGTKDIHSFLTSIREMFGIWVITTGSSSHTAAWIDDLHYWYNKKKHRTGEVMVANPAPALGVGFRRPTTLARMLVGLDGVGGRKALDLANRFGSMEELMSASPSDIMEVEGIGETIAEGIWRQLRAKR